jgi:hypothetical protein
MNEEVLGGAKAAPVGSSVFGPDLGVQWVPGVPGWLRLRVGKRPGRKPVVSEAERAAGIAELRRRSNVALVGVDLSELYLPGARA